MEGGRPQRRLRERERLRKIDSKEVEEVEEERGLREVWQNYEGLGSRSRLRLRLRVED